MNRRIRIYLLFLGFILNLFGRSQESIDLTGLWEFAKQGDTTFYPANVPGVVHLDLLSNKLIKPPYENLNEKAQSWIEEENWVYKKTFEVNDSLFDKNKIELIFEGLDTYALIKLNNLVVDSADNMFRNWVFDIKPYLKKGKNTLEIYFTSPLNKHKTTLENTKYELPAGNETVANKVSPYTRKAAYHFGWDWGPRFVTSGIWKPCYIEFWDDFKLVNYSYDTETFGNDSAKVNFTFEIESSSNQEIEIRLGDQQQSTSLLEGLNLIKQTLYISNIKCWNTIDYGNQHLYGEVLELQSKEGQLVSEKIKFAIREIELIHQPDEIGTSFYFKVNGTPVFIKGANYIPQDLFLPRVDSSRYEKLIQQAAAANINMLRVWGGGIYENDYFYDLCDQYGILVWQDFMFANSMYPNDSSFLSTVKHEVIDNIKRLRNHPCIAIWCGNNEIQVAWDNWGWQDQFNYDKKEEKEIYDTYEYLFHELIPDAIDELDPDRPYTPTSPLSNWGTSDNFNHASMHYWGVWHGKDSIENYANNVGRFMVEYGYQSYPSYATLSKMIDTNELRLNSPTLLNRQKSYIGNGIIESNIAKYLTPSTEFETWIQQTQTVQSYALKTAISAHRFGAPHCMGTLFWQLNDCWPGPSWSVIDYYGAPKKAYRTVSNYYAPIIATAELAEDILTVRLTSDVDILDSCSVQLKTWSTKNCSYPIETTSVELEALKPYEVYFKIPANYISKKNKHGQLSHFEVEIYQKEKRVFRELFDPKGGVMLKE